MVMSITAPLIGLVQVSCMVNLYIRIHFLQTNLKTDIPARKKAPVGRYTVIVSFLVDKKGKITEVKAENDPGYGTAEEAVRVIKTGPDWIPAVQNNVPVIYRQKQSIT